MRFALAIFVYLLVGVVLSAGILLLLAGKPWLLVLAVLGYVAAFGRLGCMSH